MTKTNKTNKTAKNAKSVKSTKASKPSVTPLALSEAETILFKAAVRALNGTQFNITRTAKDVLSEYIAEMLDYGCDESADGNIPLTASEKRRLAEIPKREVKNKYITIRKDGSFDFNR